MSFCSFNNNNNNKKSVWKDKQPTKNKLSSLQEVFTDENDSFGLKLKIVLKIRTFLESVMDISASAHADPTIYRENLKGGKKSCWGQWNASGLPVPAAAAIPPHCTVGHRLQGNKETKSSVLKKKKACLCLLLKLSAKMTAVKHLQIYSKWYQFTQTALR